MVLQIESFPDVVIEHLAYNLDPKDIDQLSYTSKTLYKTFHNNNLWKSKAVHDFGDLFEIYTIFSTAATGLSLDPALTKKFQHEPSDWRSYYLEKNQQSEQDDPALIDQADQEYASAQAHLKSFQENGDMSILALVASKMMWILDVFPAHGGCYYILGFILFVLNKLEEAMILLQMGRAVDPTFEPFDELEEEIERIVNGYKGEEELLTEDNQLSEALKQALLEIFNKFDKDQDGALNSKELDQFIFTTNGTHPPPAFLRQMGLRFGANAKGWLTREGFLAFYLEQTLDDPSETRNDLGVHGYDPQSLRQKMEE
ncbi:hypothetical protein G6F70_006663 [Rhizopus microsporus]|uniref:EF-hand domain-containing protein n=1 Tax=Rhizopus microsporus TaxID=58291 RepID=A0A1X0S338_RHIZD|nr:hypothetical protein G6F71_006631 [Rhizopus microsporus]KAG1197380.1 hypothetical protein G6F70_006663 [Rhizopus microsporus]KAG1213489.1 hypothetical protein G6F69_002771 [Rhizopus microsporus]KAG1230571.1 hypothetical protein G6F67_006363 [Rhizopus microsporus]KAG1268101.1 hypothetical protein G6F68_001385 [Rhizopus microsporus]